MIKESYLQIKNVSKSFGNFQVLKNVNLNINKSEFFGLLGSSGCGKSTLLRIIGGFEKADSGQVLLDGQDLTLLPAYERPLNYMFQSYALFPHLNVFNNIAFGLQNEPMTQIRIKEEVLKISKLLQLEELLQRRINNLSGGQQQRVALARCIIKKPKVLLLDEPLAALDKKLRTQTQFELINLQKKIGITFIFVTHDQEEAMILTDRMSIMKGGEIIETGSPFDIYEQPNHIYTANFIGTANLFELSIDSYGNIFCKRLNIKFEIAFDFKTQCTCLIRPEKILINIDNHQKLKSNQIRGVIEEIAYLGGFTKYTVLCENFNLNILHQNKSFDQPLISIGDSVICSWDKKSIVIINNN
jgi:putrescine transport system ATP-binding protein